MFEIGFTNLLYILHLVFALVFGKFTKMVEVVQNWGL